MSKEGKIERIRSILIEALRERRRNPKGRGWSFLDRIAGVLDISLFEIYQGDQGKLDELAGRERRDEA